MYDPIDLPQETVALRDLVRRICVDHEMPLEQRILRGEKLTDDDLKRGRDAARAAGLWGSDHPGAARRS